MQSCVCCQSRLILNVYFNINLCALISLQMLQVFDSEEERGAVKSKICKTVNGDYMPSGVTPPTFDIVKRRFELTRKNDSYLPYRIRQVIEEINSFGNAVHSTFVPSHHHNGEVSANSNSNAAVEVVSETVVEEVVEFEEWMMDPVTRSRRNGVTITLHGSQFGALKDLTSSGGGGSGAMLKLLQHPDILGTSNVSSLSSSQYHINICTYMLRSFL